MVLFIVATCLFLACTHDDSDSAVETPDERLAKSRTVMVYMIAENSLGGDELREDVREIIKGMNRLNLYAGDHLFLYVDDNGLPRIYEVKKDKSAALLTDLSPDYTYDREENSASAAQLRSFIQYAKQYDSDSYGLVMWSHASGWIPSTYEKDKVDVATAKRRSFGIDNEQNSYSDRLNGHQMAIEDMAAVLADEFHDEGGLDFLFFDACFMQCVEVDYALRNVAKFIVASPAEIPGPGADYVTMVPAMFQQENYIQQMLSAYVVAYEKSTEYGVIISSVETKYMESFATQMRDIVQKYQSQLMSLDKQGLLNYYVYGSWGKDFPDYLDMQGVMQVVLSEQEYEQWRTALDAFVNCQTTNKWFAQNLGPYGQLVNVIPSQCSGVCMTIPFVAYASGTNRFDISFQDTEWAQAVWNSSTEENEQQ